MVVLTGIGIYCTPLKQYINLEYIYNHVTPILQMRTLRFVKLLAQMTEPDCEP